jgi:hypothetical protein|tara:strand:- start:170 stop:355 length:186 start_codon:yes stop_codon:yes gene_type:complete
MIIRIEYNKNTKEITLTKDDDIIVEINESDTVDNDNELKIELAMDVSPYQELYKLEDGDDN